MSATISIFTNCDSTYGHKVAPHPPPPSPSWVLALIFPQSVLLFLEALFMQLEGRGLEENGEEGWWGRTGGKMKSDRMKK